MDVLSTFHCIFRTAVYIHFVRQVLQPCYHGCPLSLIAVFKDRYSCSKCIAYTREMRGFCAACPSRSVITRTPHDCR